MSLPGQHPTGGAVERGLIFRLAAADLRHEWVLSLCLVMALGAVIAPLLIIFGVKYGTIDTLRRRLIQDPLNREMRPLTTVTRDRDWFRAMAQRPEVGFIIPTTRQLAASVVLKPVNGDGRVEADLVPTAAGDTLLLENGATIPKSGEVVLTAATAQALGMRTGDRVTVTATRSRGGDSERAATELVVAGTLSLRASGLKAVYAPLAFLEAVEAYKDGLAVPELGWTGSLPVAYPEYDGAIIVAAENLPAEKQLALIANTGFSKIEDLPVQQLPALAGWSAGAGHVIYFLSTETGTVREDSISAVRDQLRGLGAEIFPWIRPLAATVTGGTQEASEIRVQALSVSAETAAQLGISPAPPWGETGDDPFRILLPEGSPLQQGTITLAAAHSESGLQVPVTVAVPASPGPKKSVALVPASLAGVLRLAELRALEFDPNSRQVLLRRRGYAGFRMYARSIDEVEPLRRSLAAEGIEVHTEAQRIAQVTELDRHLTRIFGLIATVGVTGSIATLVASLYASIERKRRELGVLRLVGLSSGHLVWFPVYQSLLFAAASYGLASACFSGVAVAINQLFRRHLHLGESFCKLPLTYQLASLGGALVLAALAASLAAFQVTRAAAADALRNE